VHQLEADALTTQAELDSLRVSLAKAAEAQTQAAHHQHRADTLESTLQRVRQEAREGTRHLKAELRREQFRISGAAAQALERDGKERERDGAQGQSRARRGACDLADASREDLVLEVETLREDRAAKQEIITALALEKGRSGALVTPEMEVEREQRRQREQGKKAKRKGRKREVKISEEALALREELMQEALLGNIRLKGDIKLLGAEVQRLMALSKLIERERTDAQDDGH
ncbi:hypothetical protein KIPB_009956, partial [Kipferlia bialata]